MHEGTDVIVSDFVGRFCKFHDFIFVVTGGWTVFHVFHVVVALQVNVVHVREDYFYTVVFNHVMHYLALPFSSHGPLRVVTFQNQVFIVTAHLAGWLWRTEFITYFFEQRFREPYTVIFAAHTAGCPDAHTASAGHAEPYTGSDAAEAAWDGIKSGWNSFWSGW